MDMDKSLTESILKNEVDAESFFKNQILEIDDETFITPDLNGDESEGSIHEISSIIGSDVVNELCGDLDIGQNNLFLAISSFVLSKFVYNKNLIFSNSGTFKGNSFDEQILK